MKKSQWISLVLGCLVAGSAVVWGISVFSASSTLKTAPSFTLQDASGKRHSLSDFRGDFVVLHFWATWCPPCLEELPRWVEFTKGFGGKPIRFIAISLDQNWEDARKILPTAGLPGNLLALLDPEAHVPEQFGTIQYPETYLLDRKQRIMTRFVGPHEWLKPEMKNLFLRLMR